jgi:hypothetical protein
MSGNFFMVPSLQTKGTQVDPVPAVRREFIKHGTRAVRIDRFVGPSTKVSPHVA